MNRINVHVGFFLFLFALFDTSTSQAQDPRASDDPEVSAQSLWPHEDPRFELHPEGLADRQETLAVFGAEVLGLDEGVSTENAPLGTVGIIDRKAMACLARFLRDIQNLAAEARQGATEATERAISYEAHFREIRQVWRAVQVRSLNGWGFLEPPGRPGLLLRLLGELPRAGRRNLLGMDLGFDRDLLACLATLGNVTSLVRSVPIQPRMKIDPSIAGPGDVLVTLFPDCKERGVAGNEFLDKDDVLTYKLFVGHPSKLYTLAGRRCVYSIERAPVIETRWANAGQPLALGVAPKKYAGPQLDGSGQVAGMIDLPFDLNHCAFADVLPVGPLHRKVVLFDGEVPTWSVSKQLHGTATAGLLVGDPPESSSDAKGAAPKARLAFSSLADLHSAALLRSLERQYRRGARVFSLSWGDSQCPLKRVASGTIACASTPLNQLFDSFSGLHEDALIVTAASNDCYLRSPENGRQTLAVVAAGLGSKRDKAFLGSEGPNLLGQWKPEFRDQGCRSKAAIPGTGCGTDFLPQAIDASTPDTGCCATCLPDLTKAHHSALDCATSWAAPTFAGHALLVRQFLSEGRFRQPWRSCRPSAALLRTMLTNTAQREVGEQPGAKNGWGRPLVDTIAGRHLLVDVSNRDRRYALTEGEWAGPYFFGIGRNQSAKATLSWTEPPYNHGTPIPVPADLDLVVYGFSWGFPYFPGFVEWRGNSADGEPDRTNMIEHIEWKYDSRISFYMAFVGAPQVLPYFMGRQGYSLAVSGAEFRSRNFRGTSCRNYRPAVPFLP